MLKEQKCYNRYRIVMACLSWITLKESAPATILEESVFADERILQSAPAEVELDDMMGFKRDRQHSMEDNELLKIKAMWEEGELIKAKQAYLEFTKYYPEFTLAQTKEILGVDVTQALINY
jgi:hypothetical protein